METYGLKCGIEGDEIVIRAPIAVLPNAWWLASHNWEGGDYRYKITDSGAFAKYFVKTLNKEMENGDTVVSVMLELAMADTISFGAEGLEECEIGEQPDPVATATMGLQTEDDESDTDKLYGIIRRMVNELRELNNCGNDVVWSISQAAADDLELYIDDIDQEEGM